MKSRTFNISDMFQRISKAVEPYAKAAMFELYEDGFTSTFEQIVACLISIRTRDEVTLPTARNLFQRARTAEEVSLLSPSEIDRLIGACTFHEQKARQIHQIALQAIEKYKGTLPCDAEALLSLSGVGPKCVNLALGIACEQPRVSVDIHVHRISNRWGYVATKNPVQTTEALEHQLPGRYWVEINRLLVPFGKHICTGKLPHCSTCPVLKYCRQVGVKEHR